MQTTSIHMNHTGPHRAHAGDPEANLFAEIIAESKGKVKSQEFELIKLIPLGTAEAGAKWYCKHNGTSIATSAIDNRATQPNDEHFIVDNIIPA